IHREIDAGQSLVEIVDVEENTSFRRVEGPEIHHMAVAAGLHVRAGLRKSREIMGHHGGGAPQEGEGRLQHAFVADREKVRAAGGQSAWLSSATRLRSARPASKRSVRGKFLAGMPFKDEFGIFALQRDGGECKIKHSPNCESKA